jgi:hypothetical protein
MKALVLLKTGVPAVDPEDAGFYDPRLQSLAFAVDSLWN